MNTSHFAFSQREGSIRPPDNPHPDPADSSFGSSYRPFFLLFACKKAPLAQIDSE
jgi:hypothetical protein